MFFPHMHFMTPHSPFCIGRVVVEAGLGDPEQVAILIRCMFSLVADLAQPSAAHAGECFTSEKPRSPIAVNNDGTLPGISTRCPMISSARGTGRAAPVR
jgi:hypothetical protein